MSMEILFFEVCFRESQSRQAIIRRHLHKALGIPYCLVYPLLLVALRLLYDLSSLPPCIEHVHSLTKELKDRYYCLLTLNQT